MSSIGRAGPAWLALLVLSVATVAATDSADVLKGIVHDPQHRPVAGAQVVVRAQDGAWHRQTQSDANGEFELDNVPEGSYVVTVSALGFGALQQPVTVASGKAPVTHFQLELAATKQMVEVSAAASRLGAQSST